MFIDQNPVSCLQDAGSQQIGFLLGSCGVTVALTSDACHKGLPKSPTGEVQQFRGQPECCQMPWLLFVLLQQSLLRLVSSVKEQNKSASSAAAFTDWNKWVLVITWMSENILIVRTQNQTEFWLMLVLQPDLWSIWLALIEIMGSCRPLRLL